MSRKNDIENLITKNTRRLQKLKEKQASYGLDTPVHILTEIEEVEAKLEKLNSQLDRVKDTDDVSPDESPTSILQSNNFKILMLGIGIVIIVVLSVGIPIVRSLFAPATPTPTATPTEKILFEQDFEDGGEDEFKISGEWQIVQDTPANQAYEVNSTQSGKWADAIFGETGWENYVIEYKVKIVSYDLDVHKYSGFTYFGFREGDESGYRATFFPSANTITLNYDPTEGRWTQFDSSEFNLQTGTWYFVRIEVDGQHMDVWLDDKFRLDGDDEELPLRDGVFSLNVGPHTIARFDDIRITELSR